MDEKKSEGAGGVTVAGRKAENSGYESLGNLATSDTPDAVKMPLTSNPETAPRPESLEAVRQLKLARTRIKILLGRMRGCAEEPQDHALSLAEGQAWLNEMDAALAARQGGGERA